MAVDLLYKELNDFDRECFLIGTLDDDMGHYQTFTSNKSIGDIDDDVKWMFEKDAKFMADTMARQRITSYSDEWGKEGTVLLVVALFKNDYPDLRAVRICSQCCPLRKLYGSEIVSYSNPDSICNGKAIAIKTPFEIELYSLPLAKIIAGYYKFDFSKSSFPVLSSGGDIGYRGVLNKDKISTRAQKLSFLAGIFMRYKLSLWANVYGCYSILMPNSLSTAAMCSDILKDIGCEHVAYVDRFPYGHQIFFTSSDEVKKLENLINKVNMELDSNMVVF
ncbi:hypothetical protein [Candidatus Symbiothrix dinenymphae]|uniref:hypothetical protein n=1 Tax=Candidatus Symbiothrix dinenymphae TaxID=467085 RepID=UPI00131509A8|nr:hypothetical protein [Candidatus Symbiothrix dinenymphae]